MDQFRAAQAGVLVRVKRLVNVGNVHSLDEHGFTVLHCASDGGNVDVVQWLVAMGADVNIRGAGGSTPLHKAVQELQVTCHNSDLARRARCTQLLLEAGADATIVDNHGKIALHEAYNSAACAALVIAAHPGGVNAVDEAGYTPLHYVGYRGKADVAAILLNAGSVVDAVTNNGHTALAWALRRGRRDVAGVLIDWGAKLERVKLDNDLKAIPEWAVSFVARRNVCRSSCWAMLELARRRSRVIGGNNRDVLRLISRMVWESRLNESWGK